MATKKAEASRGKRTPEAASGPFTMSDIEALIASVQGTDVTSVVWDRKGERIAIERGQPGSVIQAHHPSAIAPLAVTQHPAVPSVSAPVVAAGAAPAAPPRAEAKPGVVVTSPFVGTFYRAPSPESPPFVEVGAVVKKGQVLCIVEAMKLMNEIEAETGGKIAEIFVQNATPVEFGEPLFRIETE
jgi:acetyl-CoA carboxylase biotin carboxyl carrier protein